MPLKKIGRAIKKTVRKIVLKEVAGIMQVDLVDQMLVQLIG